MSLKGICQAWGLNISKGISGKARLKDLIENHAAFPEELKESLVDMVTHAQTAQKALNKITKDRYLPTGPELTQSAQLYDITGDKMKMLLDFPTIGEPHYAQGISADRIVPKSKKFYPLEENQHPYKALGEKDSRVERSGKDVHVYMTTIRSHFSPDNIEGIKVGDRVYFHVTNLEQDWDVPHGFAIQGANNAELLIMPGQTETLVWYPKNEGVFPFYCTDFCSALHQEMQGYLVVKPKG